ncbi:MAG: NepR family anti-sigma factor [Paracoccaceae bacterium]
MGSAKKNKRLGSDMQSELSDKGGSEGQRIPETPASPRTLRQSVAREIEENLKRVYQASLTYPLPDRFAELIARLRAEEGKR